MNPASLLRLLVLAAIWGASFLFMRIAAPVLGAAILIEFRVGIAALFLTAAALTLGPPLPARAALAPLFRAGAGQFGAVIWGVLFLSEPVGWHTLADAAVILAGTALITNARTKPPVGPHIADRRALSGQRGTAET